MGTGFTILGNALGEIYGYILGISSSLAILSLAVCAIQYMLLGDDPKVLTQVKNNAKNVLMGWIIINMLGVIIAVAQVIVQDIGV